MTGLDFTGRAVLAPLTKGGNLPFRRLCVELGAEITMSEMAYAKKVARGGRAELALLRKHADENCFGVQIAAGRVEDAVRAGAIAAERGAAFVDINCGCPIHDTIKRGMGATMMRRPDVLAKMVEAMVKELPIPVTVKLRSGWSESRINCIEVARELEQHGVHAIALHARSREQRYTKSANWDLIAELVESVSVPVIGNGDILTWYEARDRRAASGCAAVMLGRGALIKPWLFREIRESATWEPTASERVAIYARFVELLKEHFRDDEKGRTRAMRFLPWHFSFFCRYRPLPVEPFEVRSREHPLLQTRFPRTESDDPLDRLLEDPREEVHLAIANALWDADPGEAETALRALAADHAPVDDDYDEVAVAHG
ncbi:MAG: tRNA-dihydrouridine synthase [Planctomycetes bacterium]|nr:tRNA-dihydrouridine synthase [Planctomycetota bacterium]